MSDPLLTRPEFQEAVIALAEKGAWCGVCDLDADCETCDKVRKSYLTAALPFIRRALASELRAEAQRRDDEAQGVDSGESDCSPEGYAWCDAADFLGRPEVMG